MPRPTTKIELLDQGESNYLKLMDLINSYDETDRHADFSPGTLNRNVRDVIYHLYRWHLMTLKWYDVGMSDSKPKMPAEGYTWKTLPDLNKRIWEEGQLIAPDLAFELLDESHKQIISIINTHSDEELFTKKYYKWTGSTSLGAYLTSSTSSHYAWAHKLIRKMKK